MGELDVVDYKYLSDNLRYADLFNGVLFGGEQVLMPEKLRGEDTKIVKTTDVTWKMRDRDLIRKYENDVGYAVLGIENQENVSYLMPFRIMEYETGEYARQIEEIQKRHTAARDVRGDAFFSKFAKADRIFPCVTLVLYWGEKWDGPESLKGMMNLSEVPEQLKSYVNDYPIHLVNVREFGDTDVFRTDLRLVFEFMKCAKDREGMKNLLENNPAYMDVAPDAYKMMRKHTKLSEFDKIVKMEEMEEEGTVNMCQAIREIIEEAKEEAIKHGLEQGLEQGLKQGLEQGREQGILHHIYKMVERGKYTVQEALEELGSAQGEGEFVEAMLVAGFKLP